MRVTLSLSALAAVASLAAANTVEFINQDSTTRSIIFTATAGLSQINTISIPGYGTNTVTFPTGWIGNWYSVSQGAVNTPGMLGEVRFDGYAGINFFDVSAIVNKDDHNGVKKLYPKISKTPLSGCETFPCSNVYNNPDDVQTLATTEKDLVCLIGNKSNSTARRHIRDFITGVHLG